MLRRGEISVGIVVPPDFEKRRIEGREAVQVLVDGSDTSVQSATAQLAQMPIDSSKPYSKQTPPQIGVVGFSFGAAWALVCTAHHPTKLVQVTG